MADTARVYDLYVESGPKLRTTMVHVLEHLGCVANASTTQEALEHTPDAIRRFKTFLRRHDSSIDVEEPFTTMVAQHVMEGPFIGYGDPQPGFALDFVPIDADEIVALAERARWLGDEIVAIVLRVQDSNLDAEPADGGRKLRRICEHIVAAQYDFMRSALNRDDASHQAWKAIEAKPENYALAMADFWKAADKRLHTITQQEAATSIQRGEVLWTVRRMFRRTLEHSCEHYVTLADRYEA